LKKLIENNTQKYIQLVTDWDPRGVEGIFESTTAATKRTFTAFLLLSYTIEHNSVVLVDKSEMGEVKLKFLNLFVNINGEPVQGEEVTLRAATSECDYANLQQFLSDFDTQVANMSGSALEVISSKYRIDSFLYEDAWQQCLQQLTSMLESNQLYGEHVSSLCTADPNTTAYDIDPCCSDQGEWNSVCFPRSITGSVVLVYNLMSSGSYTEPTVREDLLRSQCAHASCSDSFLEDYLNVQSCPSFGSELAVFLPQLKKLQKDCYQSALGVSIFTPIDSIEAKGLGPFDCYSDTDCQGKVYTNNINRR
jgi:hypothetical protein